MNRNIEFEEAVKQNNINKLKTILSNKVFTLSFNINIYIKVAEENGYSEIVELLLDKEKINPFINIKEEFFYFIKIGDVENVKLLLKDQRLNPSIYNNWAIRIASKIGEIDIVKLLLNDKRVNPSINANIAIKMAFQNKHFDIVNILWQDQRVKDALKIDDKELYNELIKNDIKDKIEDF